MKYVAAIACTVALAGALSACSSSSSSSTPSTAASAPASAAASAAASAPAASGAASAMASAAGSAAAAGASSGVVPADVAKAFFVAFCAKNKGTLDPATDQCKTSDGSTTKIDVTKTDPTSAAMVLAFAYQAPGAKDIAGCPTIAELKSATSSNPPSVTLDCQIAAIKDMTAALSK